MEVGRGGRVEVWKEFRGGNWQCRGVGASRGRTRLERLGEWEGVAGGGLGGVGRASVWWSE